MKYREITGSLIERNGKYTAVLNLYDVSGKRRQKSIALGIPVKGNKRRALAQLEELKREYAGAAGLIHNGKRESPLFTPRMNWPLCLRPRGMTPCRWLFNLRPTTVCGAVRCWVFGGVQ